MYGYKLGLKKVGESVPAAPVNVVQPLLSGNGAVGTVVTCSNGSWTGSPSPTFSFNFRVNGVSVQNGASNTYTPLIGDDTKTLTCLVTATNTQGSASEGASNSLVVGTIPNNTVAPTVSPSGTQSTGTLITANVGTWAGTATIVYEYKWTRNGVAISGATASTYTIQSADDGTTIRVEVKGSNTYGESAFVASSNSVSAVNAIAPSNTVAPVISGTAVVGQTLTSTTGTWTGTPTPTYSYQWKRGATNIGTNATTYTLVAADAGQSITCVVTATNAGGSANATSNALSILATLLDIYPNAAAAYSVRLLRGNYYGSPAIRVRRSNDNAEQNIGFTTSGDLDTSALTTFVGANSGFIVTWFDQSGNGINGNQTTPSSQHQIVNAGAIIQISSKPTTDTLLRFPLTLTANVIFTHAVTVAKIDSLNAANYLCFGETVKGLFYGGTFASINGLGGFDGTNIRSANIENLNRAIGWFSLRSGSLFVQRDNGSEDNIGTFAGPISINTISGRALSTTEFNGKVQEQIYYNSDISANKAGIINNVNTYYGIY